CLGPLPRRSKRSQAIDETSAYRNKTCDRRGLKVGAPEPECFSANLLEIPGLGPNLVMMEIGINNITRFCSHTPAPVQRLPAMAELVAPAVRQWKGCLHPADLPQFRCQVQQGAGNKMHNLSLPLHAASHPKHAGTKYKGPILFKNLLPDNDIGNAGLVLHGDEHHTLCRSGPLANQDQAGGMHPCAITRLHRICTRNDALPPKLRAQE